MRYLRLALLPFVLVACDQQPAAPTMPQVSLDRRTTIEQIGPIEVTGEFVGSCSTFDVAVAYSFEVRHIVHLDKHGVERTAEWLVRYGPGRYYNVDDPSRFVLSGPGEVQNSHWQTVDGWLVSAGTIVKVVVPGVGPIFMETGAWKVDIATWTFYHDSGHNQYLAGDVAALCLLLVP